MSSISPLHSAALVYAADGFPVFPCVRGGKAPATQNGFYSATTDAATINAWWTENPHYNIGLATGAAGLAVVDVDRPETDGLRDLPGALPQTLVARTPRGGRHFYCRGDVASTTGKLAHQIDTRGRGGYVLLPPSATADGAYRWENSAPIADIPGWIVERLGRGHDAIRRAPGRPLDAPADIERARTLLRRRVAAGAVAVAGSGGNDATYRIACELLELGLSAPVAADLLAAEWNDHCVPPWEQDDLDRLVENAASYAQNDAGAWANDGTTSEIFADTPAVRDALAASASAAPERGKYYFEDETEQEAGRDPSWLIRDLLPAQASVLMVGPSGSYKSFVALDIALAVAAGVPAALGAVEPAAPGGVVIYATNEGRNAVKRARRHAWKLARGLDAPISNYYVGAAPLVADPASVQAWGDSVAARAAGRPVRLIVLDTVAKCMVGLNENDARDGGIMVRFVDSLVETFGCTVLCLHHTGKNEAAGARGSSALVAGFDSYLRVNALKGTRHVEVRVEQHKDADERETPWTLAGRIVGPSLAFFPTTPAEHAAAHDDADAYSPRKVGAALRRLGAIGEAAAIPTAILASELAPVQPTDSADSRAALIATAGRALARLAKSRLEPYGNGEGRGRRWFLPASPD